MYGCPIYQLDLNSWVSRISYQKKRLKNELETERLMQFDPPLKPATLVRRYKRFLADVLLQDNDALLPDNKDKETTIHCANTGKMTGCAAPNSQIFYSTSPNLKRKYPFSWELTLTDKKHFICVNTARANQLVVEAIRAGKISELLGYDELKTEVKYGDENSRIDILLQDAAQPDIQNGQKRLKPDCYIEVKSVTLLDEKSPGQGYFPDTVTTRGQKHLRELTQIAKKGQRAVLFYIILHTGIEKVAPAHHIDPDYGKLLIQAMDAGVEIIAYQTQISPQSMEISTGLNFDKYAN